MNSIRGKIFKVLLIALLLLSGLFNNKFYAKEQQNNNEGNNLKTEEVNSIMFFEEGDLLEVTNIDNPEEIKVRKLFKIGVRNVPGCLPGDPGYPMCNRRPYKPIPPGDYESHPFMKWIECVAGKTFQDLGLTAGWNVINTAYHIFREGGKHAVNTYIVNLIPGVNKAYWLAMFAKNGFACAIGW